MRRVRDGAVGVLMGRDAGGTRASIARNWTHLAAAQGFFHGHRAVHDCRAGIEILSRTLPRSGRAALGGLLESARQPRWRIRAVRTPFERKDSLKSRGYRWCDGSDGHARAWNVDVADHALESELAFLRSEVYRRTLGCGDDVIAGRSSRGGDPTRRPRSGRLGGAARRCDTFGLQTAGNDALRLAKAVSAFSEAVSIGRQHEVTR